MGKGKKNSKLPISLHYLAQGEGQGNGLRSLPLGERGYRHHRCGADRRRRFSGRVNKRPVRAHHRIQAGRHQDCAVGGGAVIRGQQHAGQALAHQVMAAVPAPAAHDGGPLFLASEVR